MYHLRSETGLFSMRPPLDLCSQQFHARAFQPTHHKSSYCHIPLPLHRLLRTILQASYHRVIIDLLARLTTPTIPPPPHRHHWGTTGRGQLYPLAKRLLRGRIQLIWPHVICGWHHALQVAQFLAGVPQFSD